MEICEYFFGKKNRKLAHGKNWSRHFWENNATNKEDWTKKESTPYFEEKQRMRQVLRKSDANVNKPSHVRVRVLESYCKGLTHFFNINRRIIR